MAAVGAHIGELSGFIKVREGVVKQWKRLYEDQEHKDVDICLLQDGEKVMADSLVLRLASPVFEAMLTHDFVERQTMSLQIEDCSGPEFRFFLRLIYTGQMDPSDWPLESSDEQGVQAPPRQPAPVLQQQVQQQQVQQQQVQQLLQQQPWQVQPPPPQSHPEPHSQPSQQPRQPQQPQLPQLQQPQTSLSPGSPQYSQQPQPQDQPTQQPMLYQTNSLMQPSTPQHPQQPQQMQQPQQPQDQMEPTPLAYSTVTSPPHPTPLSHGPSGASAGLFSGPGPGRAIGGSVSQAMLFGHNVPARSSAHQGVLQHGTWCYSPPLPPLGLLLAAARLAKKYQVEWLLFVLVDVVNQRISEGSFEKIMLDAMRTDLAPVRLCCLQFAKKNSGVRERYQAADFPPEIMFELQAVFPLRPPVKEGGDISI